MLWCHSNKTRLGMNETKYRYGFNITRCFHPVTTVSVYIYNWEFHELNGKSPSNCGLGFRSLTNKKITCYPSWVWVCVFVWVCECECVWVCCSGWMLDQTANDIYTPTNVDRYHLCCNWYAHTSFSGKRQDTTPSPLPCSNASSSMTLAFMNEEPHKYRS